MNWHTIVPSTVAMRQRPAFVHLWALSSDAHIPPLDCHLNAMINRHREWCDRCPLQNTILVWCMHHHQCLHPRHFQSIAHRLIHSGCYLFRWMAHCLSTVNRLINAVARTPGIRCSHSRHLLFPPMYDCPEGHLSIGVPLVHWFCWKCWNVYMRCDMNNILKTFNICRTRSN